MNENNIYYFKSKNAGTVCSPRLRKTILAYSCSGIFDEACYLISKLLHTTNFYLDLDEENKVSYPNLALDVTCKDKKIKVCLGDEIIIKSDNTIFCYTLLWTSRHLISQEQSVLQKENDCQILQEKDSKLLRIKVMFLNKILEFEIAYFSPCFWDFAYFKGIKDYMDIFMLKKYYEWYFYPSQNELEKKSGAILRVKEMINNEEVLMDELVFSEGFVQSYILSSKKDDVVIRLEKTSASKPKITINNYSLQTDVAIQAEMDNLIRKGSNLNLRRIK